MFQPVKVRQYLAFMKAKGYSAEAVLRNSNVDPAKLADSTYLMSVEQAKVIVGNMITLTGDQGIGLEIGKATEPMDLGIVGYAIMSAESGREALRYWINYSNALVGTLAEIELEEHASDDWSLIFTQSIPLGFVYNFCVEELMAMSVRLSSILTATTSSLKQLELSYPAPAHQQLYEQFFKGPVKFNSKITRLRFSSPDLNLALRSNDKNFNQICARQCELLAREVGALSPIESRIRDILLRSRGRIPSIQVISQEMRMSARTLRRHLQDEGTSYQKLVGAFRTDLAKEYLSSVSISTKEVAFLLGYDDTNAFRRAFKEWTGKTIKEFRAQRSNGNNIDEIVS